MKRRVAGIAVYSIVITIAFVLLLLLYAVRMRAEAQQSAATEGIGAQSEPGMAGPEDVFSGGEADVPEGSLLPEGVSLTDWNMILVNCWNPAPEGLTVELEEIEHGYHVDARIAEDLRTMLEDARAQGLSPWICSAYRSHEKQVRLYNSKVREYLNEGYSTEDARSEAGKWVAVPGTGEHETGLAVDIVALDYQLLDEGQEETMEQQWLMENSWKYGFILRYPNNRSEKTGIYYEPWHYRYVGKETAKIIYEMDICFEEYLEAISDT